MTDTPPYDHLSALDSLDYAYLEMDGAGIITQTNAWLCARLAYARDALNGLSLDQLRNPEHAHYINDLIERVRHTHQTQHDIAFSLKTREGTLAPFIGSLAPKRDATGALIGLRMLLRESATGESTPLARHSTERELEIGREIQTGFLPDTLPHTPGWEIAARFESAYEVAGDFYDAYTLSGSKRIALVLGDVCDKGVGAALFMALVRSLLRAFADQHYALGWMDVLSSDPASTQPGSVGRRRAMLSTGATALKNAMDLTNNYIAHTHEKLHMFATIFFGVLDPAGGDLAYINAGHQPPILIRADGVKTELNPTGPALGLFPNAPYRIEQVTLEPGDTLLVYTDGVIDARDAHNAFYNEQRLVALLQEPVSSADALLSAVLRDVHAHMAGVIPFDDITLLALKRDTSASTP